MLCCDIIYPFLCAPFLTTLRDYSQHNVGEKRYAEEEDLRQIDPQTDSHTNGEDNGRKSWPPRRGAGDNSCWRFCTINTGRRIIVHISVKAWRIDMKGIKRVILYPLVVVFRVLVLVLPSSTSEFASEERRFFNSVALFCGSFLSGKLTSNQAMSFHKFQFLSVPGLHEIPLLRFVC